MIVRAKINWGKLGQGSSCGWSWCGGCSMQSQQVSRSTWPSRWLTRAAAKEAGEWVAHMSRGPWSWELEARFWLSRASWAGERNLVKSTSGSSSRQQTLPESDTCTPPAAPRPCCCGAVVTCSTCSAARWRRLSSWGRPEKEENGFTRRVSSPVLAPSRPRQLTDSSLSGPCRCRAPDPGEGGTIKLSRANLPRYGARFPGLTKGFMLCLMRWTTRSV